MTDFTEMQKDIYQTAYDHGWYYENRTFGDRIALMHSELSEALEEFRNGHGFTEIYHNASSHPEVGVETGVSYGWKPEGIPIELADVIIRILDFCESEDIDMETAIRIKMKYNEGRPYRHGGKAL